MSVQNMICFYWQGHLIHAIVQILLRCMSGPEVGHSHRLHREKGPAEMYFPRQLKKFNLPQAHMTQFYSAVIESVLCSSITVWFGSASKSDIRRLQRTVRTAERIIGVHLPSLQDLYYSRVRGSRGLMVRELDL